MLPGPTGHQPSENRPPATPHRWVPLVNWPIARPKPREGQPRPPDCETRSRQLSLLGLRFVRGQLGIPPRSSACRRRKREAGDGSEVVGLYWRTSSESAVSAGGGLFLLAAPERTLDGLGLFPYEKPIEGACCSQGCDHLEILKHVALGWDVGRCQRREQQRTPRKTSRRDANVAVDGRSNPLLVNARSETKNTGVGEQSNPLALRASRQSKLLGSFKRGYPKSNVERPLTSTN